MTTIFNREHEPPEQDETDTAYKLARAAASLLPGAAFVLDEIIRPPISRRPGGMARGYRRDGSAS
jgi:hypothetical protein